MFDLKVVPALDPKTSWTHEQGSSDLLDYVYAKGMKEGFQKWGLREKDFEFIKSLILSKADTDQVGKFTLHF